MGGEERKWVVVSHHHGILCGACDRSNYPLEGRYHSCRRLPTNILLELCVLDNIHTHVSSSHNAKRIYVQQRLENRVINYTMLWRLLLRQLDKLNDLMLLFFYG